MKNRQLLGISAVLLFACIGTAQTQPDRALFRTTVLTTNLSNPTQIAFLPDGHMYLLSKSGEIRIFDPQTKTFTAAATLKVSDVREDGLHSLVLDPGFATNHRVYVLFGRLTPSSSLVVSRFTTSAAGVFDMATQKDIISIPYTLTSSDEHNTGCLTFDSHGNLYIGLADNTNNFFSGITTGFSPRDPKRQNFDSQRSAANSNDLRGKILRIHPEEDGTYTIPTGNLFPADLAKTRPEIYIMGVRHPFRLTVDEKTGWLFWAEPGPNATADDASQGPRGYDEVNMAKAAGNYGWPYCTANNFCYHEWNYQTNTGGAAYDPAALKNNSSNNTGLVDLPAAHPALVWYPYNATGTAFPVFESGGTNTSMLGPVYNFNQDVASPNKIPKYFDKHLFIFDFSRSLIHAVQLDAGGAVVAVKRFWDQTTKNSILNPIDLKIGPDGAFYFLGWGDNGHYPANEGHGNLVKLDYTGQPDPVAVQKPSTFTPKRQTWSQWSTIGLRRSIPLPMHAYRVDFFNIRGALVWSWERSKGSAPVTLELPLGLRGPIKMRTALE